MLVLTSGRIVTLLCLARQKDDESSIRHFDKDIEIVVAPLLSLSMAKISGRVGLAVHARKVDLGVDLLEHRRCHGERIVVPVVLEHNNEALLVEVSQVDVIARLLQFIH